MARSFPIISITPSGAPGTLGKIVVAGDFTAIFKGKFYRTTAGAEQAFYTSSTPPTGYTLIQATTFDVIENASYKGRYTVYTPASGSEASAVFAAGNTTINVNEVVIAPLTSGDATTGWITNVSTYLLSVGTGTVVVPPGVNLANRPIELFGRSTPAWGEGYAQNFINLAQNFAGATAPTLPYHGQSWYDTSANLLKSFNGSTWGVTNSSTVAATYKHTQSSAATTWTVAHGHNLATPFIALVQCFKDVGSGVPKMILPQDMTFVDANTLTVTFSNAETGWVLVKP